MAFSPEVLEYFSKQGLTITSSTVMPNGVTIHEGTSEPGRAMIIPDGHRQKTGEKRPGPVKLDLPQVICFCLGLSTA